MKEKGEKSILRQNSTEQSGARFYRSSFCGKGVSPPLSAHSTVALRGAGSSISSSGPGANCAIGAWIVGEIRFPGFRLRIMANGQSTHTTQVDSGNGSAFSRPHFRDAIAPLCSICPQGPDSFCVFRCQKTLFIRQSDPTAT